MASYKTMLKGPPFSAWCEVAIAHFNIEQLSYVAFAAEVANGLVKRFRPARASLNARI